MSVTSVRTQLQGIVAPDAALETPGVLLPPLGYPGLLDVVHRNEYPHTVDVTRGLVHQHFERVDSTQVQARLLVNLLPHDTWVILSAEEQTAGQGTHNRRWISPPRVNLYATFLFSLPRDERMPRIFQVAAIAVARTLQEFGLQPQIKWPNDVLLNRKKACGILCELMTHAEDPHRYTCLAGIGLNINMEKELCDSLDQPVTSMFVESGKTFSIHDVTTRVFHRLQDCVNQFCQPGNDLSPFFAELDRMLAFKGETVSIEPEEDPSSPPVQGKFLGITRDGFLKLEVDGTVCTFGDGRLKPAAATV